MRELFGIGRADPEFIKLALRRYPGELLAADFLRSDRQTAGLGALDERKRRTGYREVFAFKTLDFLAKNGRVMYCWGVDRLQRREYAACKLSDQPIPGNPAAKAFKVTAIEIPAKRERWAVQFDRRMLQDQEGRNEIAQALRQARRDARAGKIKGG